MKTFSLHLPLFLVLLSIPPLVPAPPPLATDSFVTTCPQIQDPPNGFLRWSSDATWPSLGFAQGIPGTGSLSGVNVTIPCGTAILLDVPSLNLTVLQIQGLLKVEDPDVRRVYAVSAALVLVEGQLWIGEANNHFKSKITFTLVPNPNNRQPWTGTFVPPAEPAFPRPLGHKAFVVMGGQVRMHGMPGGLATPSWVKLNVSAKPGDFQVVVDTDVSKTWPVGSRIALASTDFTPDRIGAFIISGYDTHPRGTVITVSNRVSWNHYGEQFGIPDGFGGFIDERAEVALLSRNIVIAGLEEPAPNQLEGGHFMVYMTRVPQFIEGVEFFAMGQQGQAARHSVNFHVCGDDQGRSLVRKNAIHNSRQRGIALRATHNLTIDSNVAFNISGHCYILEEGGETNNTFVNNLGIWARGVSTRISGDEYDNSPSLFLIANMMNNYIGNVAAGADSNGFSTDARGNVRGTSRDIPSLAGIIPNWTPFGTYLNNVAHSNRGQGFSINNINPRVFWDLNQTRIDRWSWAFSNGTISGTLVYKHQEVGMLMVNSASVFLTNVTAADCNWGVQLWSSTGGGVTNSKFLALSNNFGTPDAGGCSSTNVNAFSLCAPVTGCNLTSNSSNWRWRNWNHWQNPMFGITLDGPPSQWFDGAHNYTIANNRFSGYQPQCGRVSGALGTGLFGSRWWWSSSQSVSGIQVTPSNTPGIWFPPQNWAWPTTGNNPTVISYWDSLHNYAVWDRDGSMSGGTPGFVVANTPDILPPPSRSNCTFQPSMNAYTCPNTCYRTLQFTYREDGFGPIVNNVRRSRGDVSYLVVRRVEDNVVHVLDGNGNSTDNGNWRSFWVSLFAPATYEVSIALPNNTARWFWPSNITVQYRDNGACGAPVTVRLMSVPSSQWTVNTDVNQFWSQCEGSTFNNRSVPWPVQYNYVCHKQRQVLQITLLGNMRPSLQVFVTSSGQRGLPCRLPRRCGVWNVNDWYFYNTSGQELRPAIPGAMGYAVPGYDQSNWLYGQALIGNPGWNWDQVRTWTNMMNSTLGLTHYFRKSFTIANSACYSGIFLEMIPYQGMLAFLNNVEVFRWNLPLGNVTNGTASVLDLGWPNPMMNTTFINITAMNASFVEGTNYLAFEVHSLRTWGTIGTYFDTRVSLLTTSMACRGASIMPEVCDGIDNNFDGLVDIDPSTGRLFERPCWTACGRGIETCISGAFQNCTAPPSLPETCNGRDDNCDGLIDNGPVGTQLDCANGSVCFQGQCLQEGPLTVPQLVFPKGSGGWFFLDRGWPWQTYPNWTIARFSNNAADMTIRQFRLGTARFALNNNSGPVNTTMIQNNNSDFSYFFLKNFTLTAAEANNTWSLSVNLQRDSGGVVFSNGKEIMRSNMNATWNPAVNQYTYPLQGGTCHLNCYWPNTPLRSTGIAGGTVKAGVNWIAAQVLSAQWWERNAAFDMELFRNVNQSCSSLPGSPTQCVRSTPNDTLWFTFGAVWKYIDLNYTLPPNSWIQPGFDDSAWPSGPAPLGVQSWTQTRLNMNKTLRQAYYFRKNFTVADATCHHTVLFQLRALDGAVVFVNGVEAFRFQWEPQWVLPTDFANTYWPRTDKQNFTLSTGWIVNGNNTIAAEIHPSTQNTNNWYFDLAVGGKREGVNCTPLPA